MEGLELGLFMFVFADRREYLEGLRQMLYNKFKIKGEIIDSDKEFIRVVGGAAYDALEQAELTSRVIFTTYSYMGTGKSIIKMNGLVLATPRKTKMKQYINRIFRLGSDATIKRHIWDICDQKLKLCNQWNVRKAYFTDKGYSIETKKINYNDYVGNEGQTAEQIRAEYKASEKPIDMVSKKTSKKITEEQVENKIKKTAKEISTYNKSELDMKSINSIVDKLMARLKE
jgi:hypothetical protein